MIGNVLAGVRKPRWTGICMTLSLGFFTGIATQPANAAECPGHPDALGTSRTLVVDPKAHPRIGIMNYAETLPLEDHEVVLTFDDGPLPRNSNQILEILAAQCVKATFFTIGRQAQASPEGVRKLRDAGHSIGTHTQNHPLSMNRMPIERARQEIDDGIASVKAALGDGAAPAPFYRNPGLLHAEAVDEYVASQGIQVWSSDFLADDWRPVSSSRVYDLAIKRLEEKGRGILLLHDIQARTVAALPRILHELKARGYRIVHVVPATAELQATPTEPQQWQLHPPSETVAISHWPKLPNFVFADTRPLPAPALADLEPDGQPIPLAEPPDRLKRVALGVPLPREAPWPRPSPLAPGDAATALPVPAPSVFEIEPALRVAMRTVTPSSRPAEQAVPAHSKAIAADAGEFRRTIRGNRQVRQAASRGTHHAVHARRGTLKHLVQVRKRSV